MAVHTREADTREAPRREGRRKKHTYMHTYMDVCSEACVSVPYSIGRVGSEVGKRRARALRAPCRSVFCEVRLFVQQLYLRVVDARYLFQPARRPIRAWH